MVKRRKIKTKTETANLNFKIINYIVLLIAVIGYIFLVFSYNFTQDDAFISFRYAENFAEGRGLVFNQGEYIEGYTNFLWTIIMALAAGCGLALPLFAKIMGVLSGAGVLLMTLLLGKRIFGKESWLPGAAVLILGLNQSFAYWSVSGLETSAFALLILLAVYGFIEKSRMAGPILAMATLVRPEGFLVFLFLLIFDIVKQRKISEYSRFLIGIFIILLIPFGVFKLLYYNSLLPNPFYAKAGIGLSRLVDGLEYLWRFGRHYLGAGIFLVPLLLIIRKASREILMIVLLSLVYILYIVLVGGDVLKVHRFFVPLIPYIIISIVYGINRLAKRSSIIVVMLLVIIGWQYFIPNGFISKYHQAEKGIVTKMKILADRLKAADHSDFTVAVSTIGAIGYYLPGHTVIDLLGLTDSTIARHPEKPVAGLSTTWKERRFNSRYVLGRKPDYIIFSTGIKPSAPAEKSLMTYSVFLKNYRLIGFFFSNRLNNIYKKFYDYDGPLVRDIDIEFANMFSDGIYHYNERNYQASYGVLESASQYVSDTVFPYVKYTQALNLRHRQDYDASYRLLMEIIATDSMVYHAYADLCRYEWLVMRDTARALYYRDEVKRIVPWYIPRLDNMLAESSRMLDGRQVEP